MGQKVSAVTGESAVSPVSSAERNGGSVHDTAFGVENIQRPLSDVDKKNSNSNVLPHFMKSHDASPVRLRRGKCSIKEPSSTPRLVVPSVAITPVVSTIAKFPTHDGDSTSSESTAEGVRAARELAQISPPTVKRIRAWVDEVLEASKFCIVPLEPSGDNIPSSSSSKRRTCEDWSHSETKFGSLSEGLCLSHSSLLLNKRIELDVEKVPEPSLASTREAEADWKALDATGDTWDIADEKDGITHGVHAIDLLSPVNSSPYDGRRRFPRHERSAFCC